MQNENNGGNELEAILEREQDWGGEEKRADQQRIQA